MYKYSNKLILKHTQCLKRACYTKVVLEITTYLVIGINKTATCKLSFAYTCCTNLEILMDNWQEIKTSGGLWVQKHNFWLFGTLTCFEQRNSIKGEDLRQKQFRLLFNKLDRELLKRKYTNTDLIKDTKLKEKYNKLQTRKREQANFRIERLFYDELGKQRDFQHAHFYIKGTAKDENAKKLETQLIKDTLTENWKNLGTIELRDNDNTLHATSYCYKETDTQANIGTFNHIISTVTPPQ